MPRPIALAGAVGRMAAGLLALAVLSGCGTLPPRAQLPISRALPPSAESALERVALASTPASGSTGFRLMPLAFYSLDARIELIRRARDSLDIQYYLIEPDRSGRLFMRSLRDAALRGVRVRLLVDDLNTAGADRMFQGLAAFENVEVRLFNPFCCARATANGRFAASLADLRRLNHRMHNKLFVADGSMAVMGGRNIADEYFARSPSSNFVDMDVLLVGSVIPQLAGIFDTYWNSPQAYPLDAILGPISNPEEARSAFNALVDDGEQMMSVPVPRMDMLGQRPIGQELDSGRLEFAWGTAVAFADQPAKVMATSMEQAHAMSVQMNLLDRVMTATRRVIISSPYFVPGPNGVESFAALGRRGVAVVILTNSLAANDVPLVHAGYARYRPELLRTGVELYELSPAGVHRSDVDTFPGMSHGRLHAKAAVIDDAMVYIGSMNLDPRSESTNTELGLFARCPELARDITYVIDASRMQSSYRLRFGPDGTSLEWIATRGSESVVLTSEPEVTPVMRLRTMLLAPFVPEQLL